MPGWASDSDGASSEEDFLPLFASYGLSICVVNYSIQKKTYKFNQL